MLDGRKRYYKDGLQYYSFMRLGMAIDELNLFIKDEIIKLLTFLLRKIKLLRVKSFK